MKIKLSFGNYIRTTLLILAVIVLIGENDNIKTMLITKTMSASYIWCLIYANLIRPTKRAKK